MKKNKNFILDKDEFKQGKSSEQGRRQSGGWGGGGGEQGAPAPPPPFPGVNFFSHVKSENTIFLHVNNMETLVYFLNNSQVTKSGFSSKWKYYYFRKIEDRFNLWLFLINIRS